MQYEPTVYDLGLTEEPTEEPAVHDVQEEPSCRWCGNFRCCMNEETIVQNENGTFCGEYCAAMYAA